MSGRVSYTARMATLEQTSGDEHLSDGCVLCAELQDDFPLSVQLGICDNAGDNVLLESDGFALIRDISPLIPGHCLLVTKYHYSSFAQVPTTNTKELNAFKQDCVEFVSREYSPPLLFEHGSGAQPPQSGACIHHAHLHILPVQAPVEGWMREFGDVRQIESILASRTNSCCNRDYLAYEDCEGRAFLVDELEEPPPCQFIRRRLAGHLGLEWWHWKTVFSHTADLQTDIPNFQASRESPEQPSRVEILANKSTSDN
jgi:diadenosine tetraphosphate (Ap4A) HIT family hydrolase